MTRRTITDFPGRSGPRVVPAHARLYDVQQQIVEAAGGRQVDPLLWEYLFAALFEMHTASITDHIERIEKISRKKDDSQ